MIEAIKDFLFAVTHPNHWVRNDGTNNILDKRIREALLNPKFECLCEHTVVLNGVHLWIANYPYAYGDIYANPFHVEGLPKRRTVARLRDAVRKYAMEISL